MADAGGGVGPNRTANNKNPLKYGCDGGILSGADDSDYISDLDSEDSNHQPCSDAESMESRNLSDLGTSFRIFADSMARMDAAELEMMKAREASRWKAEKRRIELETELTQMMLQTQLQMASILAGPAGKKRQRRKRKRNDDDNEDGSGSGSGSGSLIHGRERALMISMLQCNFFP